MAPTSIHTNGPVIQKAWSTPSTPCASRPTAWLAATSARCRRESLTVAPALRLPLPDAWLQGVDYLASLSQPGAKHSFLLGAVTTQHAWHYFPVAVAVKWPIGLLGMEQARPHNAGARLNICCSGVGQQLEGGAVVVGWRVHAQILEPKLAFEFHLCAQHRVVETVTATD